MPFRVEQREFLVQCQPEFAWYLQKPRRYCKTIGLSLKRKGYFLSHDKFSVALASISLAEGSSPKRWTFGSSV